MATQRARIVVNGYYPIISEFSNLTLLRLFLEGLGLALEQIPGAIAAGEISRHFVDDAVRRAALFSSQAHVALQAAADAANLKIAAGAPGDSVVMSQPQIGPEHAALTPTPWIWGIAANGGAEDYAVAPDRCVVCEQAPADRSQLEICKRASAGHPNPLGAQAYASAMLAVL